MILIAQMLTNHNFVERAKRLSRGNKADARDLLHDTFVKAATTKSPSTGHLAGWLMRVMWSVHMNRWRRGDGKRGQYRYDNPFVSLDDQPEQPDDWLTLEQEYDLERMSLGGARRYLENSPLAA